MSALGAFEPGPASLHGAALDAHTGSPPERKAADVQGSGNDKLEDEDTPSATTELQLTFR